MASAAQRVAVLHRAEFQVGDCVVEVLEAEGCVQMIWRRGGDDARAVIFNAFVSREMAGQLRALAGGLDDAEGRRAEAGRGQE